MFEFHTHLKTIFHANDVFVVGFIQNSILEYSEVHNIDDSDDEQYSEETNRQNIQRMPSSKSHHQIDAKSSDKPYDRSFDDDDDDDNEKHAIGQNQSGSYRSYLRNELQKQSASKLHRYLAVKRSIKW